VQSDAALVDSVKQGETAAYEQLVLRYQHAALVAALRVVKDRQQAEDVVQDALVLAYRHLQSLRDGSRFGPWLLQITRREAVRAAKSRRQAVPVQQVGEPVGRDLAPWPASAERLIGWINRLPLHEQLVVTLHYLEGRSAAEIARLTGRPLGTVTKQLSRAIQRLRRWASREEQDDE
jgi:RNA polymerase sigma-70 factor (ECF subfamily)